MTEIKIVRIYNRKVPSGITASAFTQKGEILVGIGAGTYVAKAPGANGKYLKYESSEVGGITSDIPSLDVQDTTNHLFNGGFWFAQRQAPGTLTTITDNKYSADRWRITRETADLQYIRQDGAGESGLLSPYYGQFKKITNAGKFLICQPLEYLDTLKFRGKTVNFQLAMKASGTKTIKIAVVELQAAGVADSLPAALVSAWNVDGTDPTLGANLANISTPVSCAVTSAWQVFQFTGDLPTTSKNMLMMIWSNDDFAVNDTLSLAEAGLYYGINLRSWIARPYSEELKLIERYYQKSYSLDTAPGTATSISRWTGIGATASFIVPFGGFHQKMRIAPTISIWSINGTISKVTTFAGVDTGAAADGTTYASPKNFYAINDGGAPYTAGVLYTFQYAAEAEL